MKVLIIVAMTSELQGFLDKNEYECKVICGLPVYQRLENKIEVNLVKCEVGKVNAAMITTALIMKIKPNYVINAGIGGGLNESIQLLDVIASSKTSYHDFDLTAFGYKKGEMDDRVSYFKGSSKLLSLLDNDIKKGLIISGDTFVSGIEKLQEIKKDFPKALVCDMEGCAIAHVASKLSKKFLIIRCVSDNVFLKNHTDVYKDYKPKAIEKVVEKTNNLIAKL